MRLRPEGELQTETEKRGRKRHLRAQVARFAIEMLTAGWDRTSVAFIFTIMEQSIIE